MKRALFIGRWQPLHPGHKWLFNQKLEQDIPIREQEQIYLLVQNQDIIIQGQAILILEPLQIHHYQITNT